MRIAISCLRHRNPLPGMRSIRAKLPSVFSLAQLSWLTGAYPYDGESPFYNPHKICCGFQYGSRSPSPFFVDGRQSGSNQLRRIVPRKRASRHGLFLEMSNWTKPPVSNRERQAAKMGCTKCNPRSCHHHVTSDKSYLDGRWGGVGANSEPLKT